MSTTQFLIVMPSTRIPRIVSRISPGIPVRSRVPRTPVWTNQNTLPTRDDRPESSEQYAGADQPLQRPGLALHVVPQQGRPRKPRPGHERRRGLGRRSHRWVVASLKVLQQTNSEKKLRWTQLIPTESSCFNTEILNLCFILASIFLSYCSRVSVYRDEFAILYYTRAYGDTESVCYAYSGTMTWRLKLTLS